MLSLAPSIRIYLHAKPIDMRKSFDALFGIVKSEFTMDVRNSGLFMFINLRRNRVKLMYRDTDGLAIWIKSQESEDTHFNIFTRVENIVLSKESLTKLVQLASEYRIQNGGMQRQLNQEESLPPAHSQSGTNPSGSSLKIVRDAPIRSASECTQRFEQNHQQASIASRRLGGRS